VFIATSYEFNISFLDTQDKIIELFSNNSGLSVEVLNNTQGVFNILHSSGTVQLSDNTHFAYFSRFMK
jgi:hypothetical protein